MLREKLFLSIIFLILSMFGGLACIPMFSAILVDAAQAVRLGTGMIFVLPVVSLGLMWMANPRSNYMLRHYCFLAWAALLCFIGVTNFVLVKNQENSNNAILILGLLCAAISFHAGKKAQRKST